MKLVSHAALLCLAFVAGSAAAQPPDVFAVHLGVNQAPAQSALPALQYADDDAVRFHRFTASFSARSWLMAVFDGPTSRRHRELLGRTTAPNRAGVEQVFAELDDALAESKDRGRRRVVLLSYSGHGVMGDGGIGLALLDGTLDHSFFVERVARLDADEVHLFFDACHAEGVVGGKSAILRERDAEVSTADPALAARVFDRDFFARHPHIGAVLASSSAQRTHEWSRLEAGVFTHELLSGLRGPADINGDGRVAYSELSAFVAAANRNVTDEKAVPQMITRPPRLNPGAVLVDLLWLRDVGFLVGNADSLGHFTIEGDDGLRLLDAHLSGEQNVMVAVPADQPLWLRTKDGEAPLRAQRGQQVDLAAVHLTPTESRARGSVASALQRGLFAAPFGRAYYSGWVDSQGLLSVEMTEPSAAGLSPGENAALTDADAGTGTPWAMLSTLGLLGAAGASGALSAMATTGMLLTYAEFQSTDFQAPAADAAARFYLLQWAAVALGVTGIGLAGAAGGAAVYWATAE